MNRVDELVERLRLEVGLAGFPCILGTERLLAHLGGWCEGIETEEPGGLCLHRPPRAYLWYEAGGGRILAHELGHALLHAGLWQYLKAAGASWWETERAKAEHLAERFARAWLLPSGLMTGDDDEIEELSGCDQATIRLRRRDLWERAA